MHHALLMLLVIATTSLANIPEDQLTQWFQAGNRAYRAGEYATADSLYQQILQAGYESAALYYNLGNTHYKMGHIGQAIFYYRKALHINPSDPDAQKNLKLARLKIVDKIELPPQFFLLVWWHKITHNNSYRFYGKLFLLIWWLMFIWGTIYLVVRNSRWRQRIRPIITVMAICLIFIGGIGYAAYQVQEIQRTGVIISDIVTVRSAPEQNATELFILHEGSEVAIQEKRGNWYKIQLLDGKSGWVPLQVMAII